MSHRDPPIRPEMCTCPACRARRAQLNPTSRPLPIPPPKRSRMDLESAPSPQPSRPRGPRQRIHTVPREIPVDTGFPFFPPSASFMTPEEQAAAWRRYSERNQYMSEIALGVLAVDQWSYGDVGNEELAAASGASEEKVDRSGSVIIHKEQLEVEINTMNTLIERMREDGRRIEEGDISEGWEKVVDPDREEWEVVEALKF
ncbi:hypothetical protein IQ06DRAFT_351712 [Phaeosphaeriaceae sp. SRC1lsM3a]|nr:hypothetical protein IQ06DRAFT_351712 [Stagonospora sp. SRC1lsM3a]